MVKTEVELQTLVSGVLDLIGKIVDTKRVRSLIY